MNNQRRKDLQIAIDELGSVQSNVSNCQEEEQEYFDTMPEGLQGSEKGDRASEVADELMDIETCIQDLIDRLSECME